MGLTIVFRACVTVTFLAVASGFGCAKASADAAQKRSTAQTHLAAGCLEVCKEATYVEVSPKGDLCRCWAPNAFQYTFAFPDTSDKLSYSRSRWNSGIENVHKCRAQGLAWEPSPDRDQIICLGPSEPRAVN
jgi:hypothetical protein